jgi:putative ABC transport system permease protein
MRFEALLYFYGRRLRTHPVQEALAGMGIAVGVALAFAVLVANSSVTDAVQRITQGVAGTANLQLKARSPGGMDERLLLAVRRIPGVKRAAPLLEERAVIVGPNGHHVAIDFVSVDPSLAALSGRLAGNFVTGGLKLVQGVMLPSATASELGLRNSASDPVARPLPRVRVEARSSEIRSVRSPAPGSRSCRWSTCKWLSACEA